MQRLYLSYQEIVTILHSLNGSLNEVRDRCMIFMAFIHGFRVSELTALKLSDIDITGKRILINRLKNGFSTIHPLYPIELKLLNDWLKVRGSYNKLGSKWLFFSRQGSRLSRQRFYILVKNLGGKSDVPLDIHPHMLRHSCGYDLANQGLDTRLIQDYLGHRNIRHTVHYTASNPTRFLNAWKCRPPSN